MVRQIVVCSNCQRQYDAAGKAPGKRFRCHCGAVVVIPRSQGHDAAVVRCSSCGAPRQGGSPNCQFCGSDFTLHERDLHTVCPECLARVSDRAKYCHGCGLRLAPESVAGRKTRRVCPHCTGSRYLTDRRIGELSVLECGRCAGLWLNKDAFERLTEQAAAASFDVDQLFASVHPQPAPPPVTEEGRRTKWRYRNCPECGQTMQRRNYGSASGVIVDVCREHGVWFDADELRRILAWVRSGELTKANRQRAEQAERERQAKPAPEPPATSDGWGSSRFPADSLLDVFLHGMLRGRW